MVGTAPVDVQLCPVGHGRRGHCEVAVVTDKVLGVLPAILVMLVLTVMMALMEVELVVMTALMVVVLVVMMALMVVGLVVMMALIVVLV